MIAKRRLRQARPAAMVILGAMTAIKRMLAAAAVGLIVVAMTVPGLPAAGHAGPAGDQVKKDVGADVDLPALLAKAAEYCRKLNGAALYFICLEEIIETIDPSLDVKKPLAPMPQWFDVSPRGRTAVVTTSVRKIKHTLLYDYQCVREKGETTERRTLLRENKKELNEPNASLKTTIIVYEMPLFGPAGMFGERVQPHFDYAVVGREKFERKPVVIVQAVPKPDAPPGKDLYGKAWIDPASGDIVKIEWSPSRVGHFEVFKERGEKFKLEPRLTLTSVFEVAKNGLRFPTRLLAEEAYLNSRGRAFVRSTTVVTYKDFKFFTVEVDVR
jgi:hypothetical protein